MPDNFSIEELLNRILASSKARQSSSDVKKMLFTTSSKTLQKFLEKEKNAKPMF